MGSGWLVPLPMFPTDQIRAVTPQVCGSPGEMLSMVRLLHQRRATRLRPMDSRTGRSTWACWPRIHPNTVTDLHLEPGAAGEFTERSHPAHIFDRIAVIF
jgi:hypothetical protein